MQKRTSESEISAETSNIAGMLVRGWEIETTQQQAATDITNLWAKAISLNFPDTLANRKNPDLALAITRNWFGEGPIRYLLGAEVSGDTESVDNLVTYSFPASRCAVFNLAGRIPNVIEDWDSMWKWLEKSGETWTREASLRIYNYRNGRGSILLPLLARADSK